MICSAVSSRSSTWTALIGLLSVHLGTNYLAVKAVTMKTLNRQRANLLFSMYLSHIEEYDDFKNIGSGEQRFLAPSDISPLERIFERDGILRWKGGKAIGFCEIGVPVTRILDIISKSRASHGTYLEAEPIFTRLLEEFANDDYIIWYDEKSKTFLVSLKAASTALTQLHSWMHVLLLAHRLQKLSYAKLELLSIIAEIRNTLKPLSLQVLEDQLQKAGWDTELGALETKSGTRIIMGIAADQELGSEKSASHLKSS